MGICFVYFDIFVVRYSVVKVDQRLSIQYRVKMHELDFYKRSDELTSTYYYYYFIKNVIYRH